MTGRIGIDDVAPVVDGARHPATAVVGEIAPVTPTVWREGDIGYARLRLPYGSITPRRHVTPLRRQEDVRCRYQFAAQCIS